VGSLKSLSQQNNGPNTDPNSSDSAQRHYPLGDSVTATNIRVPPNPEPFYHPGEFVLRFAVLMGLAFIIMPAAARFSGRDWGRSAWRFYGGLLGGLSLCLLCGLIILGWPFIWLALS
jgi:hypothetical protein